jgi:hypothetical protein
MWPFKKKPGLIDSGWLVQQGINTDFVDAFRYSKGVLRVHLSELEQQQKMWNSQLGDLHTDKTMRNRKMKRLTKEAENPEISQQVENDLMAQLKELNKQSVQDSKRTREGMASLREVEKTQWLLKNIRDGTFTDPKRISSPPAEGWGGDWEDLFDSIPDAGSLDDDTRDELRKKLGINKGKPETPVADSVVEEDLDPEV